MSSKVKGGRGGKGGKSKTTGKPVSVIAASLGAAGINAEVHAVLGKSWAHIQSVLPQLDGHAALDANACVDGMRGTRNKFDVRTLIAGFKENPGWRYTCSINITWLNQFFSPCPGVPLSMAKITRIRYTIITIDDYHVLLGITK